MRVRKTKVSYVSLLWCRAERVPPPRHPINVVGRTRQPHRSHTGPWWAHKESAKYMDDEFKMKKTKIKLHKIFCEYIYNCRFLFFQFFFFFFSFPIISRIQLCYIKAKHSHSSARSPMTCRYLCFPSRRLTTAPPFPLPKVSIHHIPLYSHKRPNHKVWASACSAQYLKLEIKPLNRT